MSPFSKPVPIESSDQELHGKRKRTLAFKLTTEDNVHEDAIKRRKVQSMQSAAQSSTPTKLLLTPDTTTPSNATVTHGQPNHQQQSIVLDNDEDDGTHPSNNGDSEVEPDSRTKDANDDIEGSEQLQEETDEQELGK